jgi:hypothetical protein
MRLGVRAQVGTNAMLTKGMSTINCNLYEKQKAEDEKGERADYQRHRIQNNI